MRCLRFAIWLFAAVLIFFAGSASAADLEPGVWRGDFTVESPRSKESKIDTKAALHNGPTGSQLYLEHVNKALAIVAIQPMQDGTFEVTASGDGLQVTLRSLRVTRNGLEAAIIYAPDVGAPLTGKASLDRVKPLSPPSLRAD